MPITPDDIVNYPLKQSVRGYSVKQVDELLDEVADELERLQGELAAQRSRATDAEARLQQTSETESTLKRTLVTAQRAAEQTLEEAQARAEEMVQEAESEAASIVHDAERAAEEARETQRREAEEALEARQRELGRLERRVDELRELQRRYLEDLRRRAQRQLDEIDDLEQEAVTQDRQEVGVPDETAEGGLV